jgi:hypothetical protein
MPLIRRNIPGVKYKKPEPCPAPIFSIDDLITHENDKNDEIADLLDTNDNSLHDDIVNRSDRILSNRLTILALFYKLFSTDKQFTISEQNKRKLDRLLYTRKDHLHLFSHPRPNNIAYTDEYIDFLQTEFDKYMNDNFEYHIKSQVQQGGTKKKLKNKKKLSRKKQIK